MFLTIAGDVDGDRDVDIYDIVTMGDRYGSLYIHQVFIIDCDINDDGRIDIYDIVIAAGKYGESW